MKIRTTWILIENNKILLLDQDVNDRRSRSLPWGTLEKWESLELWLVREMKEETWLNVKVGKLIYISDLIKEKVHVLHIMFFVEKIWWKLWDKVSGVDTREIRSVEMVDINKLETLGFTSKFQKIVLEGFPDCWSYVWAKENIWL